MIRIDNINGKNYFLDFSYISHTIDNQPKLTYAKLIEESKRNSGDYEPEFSGFSYRHASDRHIKETGRKLAIERMVKDFDRPTRAKVWEAYFSRK